MKPTNTVILSEVERSGTESKDPANYPAFSLFFSLGIIREIPPLRCAPVGMTRADGFLTASWNPAHA
jgi:hypothetical protein